MLPINQHNFPPVARNGSFVSKQEVEKQMLFCPSLQAQLCNNVLMSDGRFLYQSKDLTNTEVEDLRDSVSEAIFFWTLLSITKLVFLVEFRSLLQVF